VEKLRVQYEEQSLHQIMDGDVQSKMEGLVSMLQAENQVWIFTRGTGFIYVYEYFKWHISFLYDFSFLQT